MQTALRSNIVSGVCLAACRTSGVVPRPLAARTPCATAAVSTSSTAYEHTQMQALDVESRRLALAAERRQRAAEREQQAQAEAKWWEVDCPSNMVNVTTVQELQAAIASATASGVLAVVNFFAEECYACRSLQPKLRQIARDAPEVAFIKVNGSNEELRVYCEQMGISRIPYFHLYRDGQRVSHFTANMRPEKLRLLRSEIAQHRSGSSSSEAPAMAPMAAFC